MIPENLMHHAGEKIKRSKQQALFFRLGQSANTARSALSEAERNRLVKASKSPTINLETKKRFLQRQENIHLKPLNPPIFIDHEAPHYAKNTQGAGRYVVIGHREWADEYRVRTEVHPITKPQPPEQSGDRATEILSERGARKIADSCHYMTQKYGGYTTFLTLTLDPEARARVDAMETTIQREISRFFDGLQKMYQRGFSLKLESGETYSHPPAPIDEETNKPEGLDYTWVCEIPDRIDEESGELIGTNPHVHVLMRFRVPYKAFQPWAERIEKLWGQGFANLEKIKDGEKAGAYMAKAAGYLCKAQGKSNQGTVSGNRYNISKSARAPDWVCIGRYELGRMGFLLSEASENFEDKFGHFKNQRDRLREQHKTAQGVDRIKIGKRLEKTRQILQRMPRMSKYQAVLKGEQQFNQFMEWANTDEAVNNHSWLPNKEENEGFLYARGMSQWRNEFDSRHAQIKENRAIRRDLRKWNTWFDDTEHYIMGVYRETKNGNYQEPKEAEQYFAEYADYEAMNIASSINF